MARYALATVREGREAPVAMVLGDALHPLPGRPSMADVLAGWDEWLPRLDELAASQDGEPLGAVAGADLGPAVPRPANLYMAGANYADHSREMRDLPADADVPKPERGPFMFLKPTSAVIADGDPVRLAPGADRVDWEVELAVVIGRHGYRLAEDEAGAVIAGYTIANDVSVRGRFVRDDIAEPPMRFDWFAQKGWATSCPLGPWLVPAAHLPDAQSTGLRLSLNGEVQQDSSTAEMIFSIAEQIAYISSIVPLVPGDVICTGTCAGVGMGRGQFLSAGDEMVAEIDGIGALRNPVVDG